MCECVKQGICREGFWGVGCLGLAVEGLKLLTVRWSTVRA